MKKSEQKRIVNELIDVLKARMEEGLDRVPENWDGFELRSWLAEIASRDIRYSLMTNKRQRDFRNDLLVKNL